MEQISKEKVLHVLFYNTNIGRKDKLKVSKAAVLDNGSICILVVSLEQQR